MEKPPIRTPFSLEHIIHTEEKSLKVHKSEKAYKYSPAVIQQRREHTGRMPYKFHKFWRKKLFFRGSNWLDIGEGKLCVQIIWKNLQGSVNPHWTVKKWSKGRSYVHTKCGKALFQESDLRTHQRIQKGEKSHKCTKYVNAFGNRGCPHCTQNGACLFCEWTECEEARRRQNSLRLKRVHIRETSLSENGGR